MSQKKKGSAKRWEKKRTTPVVEPRKTKQPPSNSPLYKGGKPARQKAKKSLVIPVAVVLALAGAALMIFHFRGYFRPQAKISFGSYKDFNVVLLTIDTLRADHLPAYGYKQVKTPHIDQLAKESFLFTGTVAHVPLTLPSHTSIFTGLLPVAHGVVDNAGQFLEENITTFTEILKDKGYATAAFVSSFVLDSKRKLDQGFDLYYDNFEYTADEEALNPTYIQRRAGETYSQVEKWIQENKDNRFFLWVHYFDPHDPYDPPEPYGSLYASAPYDGEIAYTDEFVGRLLDQQENLKLKNRTIFILTGDHGEGLGQHGEPHHGVFIYDTTQHVPLLIRLPKGKKQIITQMVRHIDLAPTILEWLGIPPDAGMQGKSLIPLLEGKEKQERTSYSESRYAEIHFGWSRLKGITTKDYKYIEAPKPELYDRKNDSSETRNLIDGESSIAKALHRELNDLVEAHSRVDVVPASSQKIDPEEEEKLRALGYIGTVEKSTPESRRIDPKDKYHLVLAFTRADIALKEKNNELTLQLLAPVLKEAPNIVEAHFMAGVAYFRTQQYEKAIEEYRKTLNFDPESSRTLFNLGLAHRQVNQPAEAELCFLQILKHDKKNSQAMMQLAELYIRRNEKEKAKTFLSQATVEIHRESSENRAGPQARSAVFAKLAELYFQANELDRAEENLRAAIALIPQKPALHYNLGLIYEQKSNFVAALEEYKKETRISPNNHTAFKKLGLLYRKFGRFPEAIDCFRKALQIRPQDPELTTLLAETVQ